MSALAGAFGSILGGMGSGIGEGLVGTAGTSSTQTGTQLTSKKINPEAEAALLEMIKGLSQQAGFFTPEQAEEDSEAGMQLALTKVMEQYLPQIAQGTATSGMYGSTNKQLLLNDLATQAALESSKAGTQTKIDYANVVSQLMQSAAGGTSQLGFDTKTDSKTKTKTSGTGILGGLLG